MDYGADVELLERWRTGDQKAGAELYGKYADRVIWWFRNKSGEDVDDLVQKTFLRLVEARERVRDGKALAHYIHRIARNVLYERLREARGPEFDPEVDSIASLIPGPSSILGRKQEHRLFVAGLRDIPLKHQIVLELFYWEGKKAGEIAEIMGVSHSAIRSRLVAAREALERSIAKLGESESLVASTISGIDQWASEIRAHFESER